MFLPARVLPAMLAVLVVAGCSENQKVTQVAAKVNKDEITVHQVNRNLPKLDNPSEEQQKAVSRQVLERLVDQQLLVQRALEQKLDRDPQILMAIENARREILSRAYLERVMSSAPKPSSEEVRKFFAEHPALFSQRRIYRLQEIILKISPDQEKKVREAISAMKTLQDVANFARDSGLPATVNSVVRSAEQLPMGLAARLLKMKDGETVSLSGNGGIAVVQLLQSEARALDETTAMPLIEQFIQNKSRAEIAQTEIKHLRNSAKIEFVGEFATSPRPAETLPGADVLPSATGSPALPEAMPQRSP